MWSNFYSLDHALTVCEGLRRNKVSSVVPHSSSSSSTAHGGGTMVVTGGGGGGGVRDVGATNASSMSVERALVVILGRMGGDANMKKALKLILADSSAVPEALSFIQQQQQQQQQRGNNDDDSNDDVSLWTALVSEFVSDANTIKGVLQHVGKFHLDPRPLIKALPANLHLPNLRANLDSLFQHTAARRAAMGDCVAVLRNDVLLLLRTLHRLQRRATKVERTTQCGLCARVLRSPAVHLLVNKSLLSQGYQQHFNDVVVFASGECYHTACLTEAATLVLHREQGKTGRGQVVAGAEPLSAGGRRQNEVQAPTTQLTTLKHHCRIYAQVVARRERRARERERERLTAQQARKGTTGGGDTSTAALHAAADVAMAQEGDKDKGPVHGHFARVGGSAAATTAIGKTSGKQTNAAASALGPNAKPRSGPESTR
jgi:hypothetical protein